MGQEQGPVFPGSKEVLPSRRLLWPPGGGAGGKKPEV